MEEKMFNEQMEQEIEYKKRENIFKETGKILVEKVDNDEKVKEVFDQLNLDDF